MWGTVYGKMVEAVIKIKTLQARLVSVYTIQTDLNKAFIQLTLEFLTKQKFEAYDSKGSVVAVDKKKEAITNWCLYVTSESLRSLYSIQELADDSGWIELPTKDKIQPAL
ncbi:hypothetical protein HID58_031909 [Brassica napus]|uniref:Uncharacterized protein n=1 Tax=Brassica napus TaxID=3708 RepID=A0ABQ8BW14_BRANA|nr:hypothetical protein HID58_031909 [Brassica napus]